MISSRDAFGAASMTRTSVAMRSASWVRPAARRTREVSVVKITTATP
jgi:hypothetical protein